MEERTHLEVRCSGLMLPVAHGLMPGKSLSLLSQHSLRVSGQTQRGLMWHSCGQRLDFSLLVNRV